MKLFIDTANIPDIEETLATGAIRGITTNPSLLSKEPKGNYIEHLKKIVALAKGSGFDPSLSVEVFSEKPDEILRQAREFVKELRYDNLAIKVHISYKGENTLAVIKKLSSEGVGINCTACMTPMQAMMAAASGVKYVSLFYNRIRDGKNDEKFSAERSRMIAEKALEENCDFDPDEVIRETRTLIADYPKAEIISGSIRTITDVKHAGLAGSHIVTLQPKIFRAALLHFKTDEVVSQFLTDFQAWLT